MSRCRERFCNKFNHHAFRYAEVRGLAQRPRREDFRALAIHTDYRPEATFTSSDSDLNAIHDMIAHTLRCLAYNGYMVDCPHLERAGYGGKPSAVRPRSTATGCRHGTTPCAPGAACPT